jgi:hypothetical protein
MSSLIDRYSKQIRGLLSCYDRVIINGTLPGLCFAEGMTSYLYANKIRIFDFPKWAEPFREQLKANAERLAQEQGLEVEFIRRIDGFRKEDRIRKILNSRGAHPGLVHIFSAMETCRTFQPWHDKKTGKTFLKDDSGRCLHYYFYFIDQELGLCYLRVPTWAPFRLQVYFNGHAWLAARLKKKGIAFDLLDNAFTRLDDWEAAQKIADDFDVLPLHRALDRFAKLYGPAKLPVAYHWSVMQAEYATDIVFESQSDLKSLYDHLVRTAVHAVKADNVATFLGKKLSPLYQGEIGNDFHTRIEGTRIKHHMGPASIKMYDKFGHILRIETTTNDLSFFRHGRMVERQQGRPIFKIAPLKKSIYSLAPDLQKLLAASNARYLAFLSDLDDPTTGIKALHKISEPVQENDRPYRGYNFFHQEDQTLFETLLRGEYVISGLRNKDLRQKLQKSTSHVSHSLKRLRLHGLIKRVGKTYKYYLTDFGRRVALLGLKLKELYIIPTLAYGFPS